MHKVRLFRLFVPPRDYERFSPEEPALDPRSMAEEVDIISKLPADLYKNLASSKWKERKEALDDLLTLLKASLRIKDGPEIGELAKALATRINGDANVMCVIVAANCLESLADGLMAVFSRHREAVVPPVLERLKERKANVTDAIGLALDAVFKTVCSNFCQSFLL
jgi:cytoskeleton-associated protein 5